MKTVRDILTVQELSVISKQQTVLEAAQLMASRNIGALPVVEGDRVVGIFSERDVMNRVVAKNLNPQKTRVEQVMTKNLIVASQDETVDEVERKMKLGNIRHLPIVLGDKLVGMLSLRDLLQAGLKEKDEEIKIMTAYIHYIPPTFES